MIDLLRREFEIDRVIGRFAEAIKGKKGAEVEAIAKKYFEGVGKEWMTKAIQLAEEYPDRTYEVLRAAIDHTGVYRFPFLLQRPIEIAYLGMMGIYTLPILQNNCDRLAYRMVDCPVFKVLVDKCGQALANKLPCQHACLAACQTVAQNFDIDVAVEMQGTTPKDGYCQFSITPL
jgi:hypothetical protein